MADNARQTLPIQLRSIQADNLYDFMVFWNDAFAGRRNFVPLTAAKFRERVLLCPSFDPAGLLIAWTRAQDGAEVIAGFVHAFQPPPNTPAYKRWGRYHTIAALYVAPHYRNRGVGGRLLKAAENWLYYSPVHFAAQSVPCYGGVEGPRTPFFGSSQRMGVNAKDADLLHFLDNRGYKVVDPGDISLRLDLHAHPPKPAAEVDLAGLGLRLELIDSRTPIEFTEPTDRPEYTSWSTGSSYSFASIVLADQDNALNGHICWFPMNEQRVSKSYGGNIAGIYSFWLTPALRGKGLGALLLDSALNQMKRLNALGEPFHYVEVQSHVTRHATAVALYESRGFQIEDAWVTLVKA